MPNTYTPEQVAEAKEWLKDATIWGWPEAKIALAALEAAEKERDDAERARDDADIYAKAYAAKLEKAGDAISKFFPNNSDYVCNCCFCTAKSAWEAARKEKP